MMGTPTYRDPDRRCCVCDRRESHRFDFNAHEEACIERARNATPGPDDWPKIKLWLQSKGITV